MHTRLLTATLAISLTLPTSLASAAGETTTPDATAHLVGSVDPTSTSPSSLHSRGDQFLTSGSTAKIPENADSPVPIDTDGEISLSIEPLGLERGKLSATGSVVYAGEDMHRVVTAPKEGGIQVATVLDDPKATHTIKYSLDASTRSELHENHDGSLTLYENGEPVAHIAAPWARDRNGTSSIPSIA